MYHPFQDRPYMLMMAILKRGLEKVLWGRDLVRMSVTWCLVLMDINLIAPDWTLSWTKWQSISICLVHWWKVWLLDSNLIIAVDGRGCCRWGVEVLKELWESNEFTDGVGECAMFFFDWRSRDHWLFLSLPRDRWITKEYAKSYEGPSSFQAGSPIWIWEGV